MRTNWFHILVALAERDMHGSDIARDVLERTNGRLRLWPATLYRTLDDLAKAELIVELEGEDRPDGGGGRERYYRITAPGREALSEESERLIALAGAARRRLHGA